MERQNFWSNKSVLVTGHTGFKGSWLSLWLGLLGVRVTGYALQPPTNPNLFESAKVAEGIQSVHGDVRDGSSLMHVFDRVQPEIVFHLAAQSLARYSYENPVETYATNVLGTVNVLEAIRGCSSVKAVVIVTSDKCYENHEWVWSYRESDGLGGQDPYSSSKACAELAISAYWRAYFAPGRSGKQIGIASARAGNVIGGGDWATDRIVPDIVGSILKKEPLLLRNPKATRPWQHVLEPLNGYLTLAEKLWEDGSAFSGAWNFGPREHDVPPVAKLANIFFDAWGEKPSWIGNPSPQPHEASNLRLDCSKANTHLQWVPKLDIRTAVEWTVEWYQGYSAKLPLKELTVKQIQRYDAL